MVRGFHATHTAVQSQLLACHSDAWLAGVKAGRVHSRLVASNTV